MMTESREHPEHTLSWEVLSRVVIMGIGLLLLWKAFSAVAIIVIALVLTASLEPLAHYIHKKMRLPMLLSTFVIFFILFIPFLVMGLLVLPDFNNQLPQLLSSIDSTLAKLPYIGQMFNHFSIVDYMKSHSSDIVASSGSVLVTFFSAITTLILSFYFVYDYDRLLAFILSIVPYKEKVKLKGLIEEVVKVTGQYIRGNVIISFITFLVVYVGLSIIGIPFALPLALFAGIVDLLPLVGSTLGSIPALLVAFSLSPVQGFSVLILHLVYQQIENGIISPVIYNKALNLYPAFGFVAVLIGASIFGIFGAFLALPVAASIPALMEYHKNYLKRQEN